MSKTDRRGFLKGSLATLMGAATATMPNVAKGMGRGPERPGLQVDRVVESNCQFCQVRCRLNLSIKDDRVVLVESHPEYSWTGGSMCPKGRSQLELLYSEHRLLYPMIRKGDAWERITYQQALDTIVEHIQDSRKKNPQKYKERVALFSPLWDCREGEIAAVIMMEAAGYPNIMTPGETCISSASNMLGMMLGTPNSTTTVDELMNTELLLLWGANIAETLPPYARWVNNARAKGTKVIFLDCRSTHTSNLADKQIMIRPGSDGVLAMGVLRHLISSGQYDRQYVSENVKGFEGLAQSVQPFTPEKVESITGVAAAEVVALADAIGRSKRTILWLGGGLSRYSNGMQTIRALISMQGITNRLIGPGNGIITMEGGKPQGEPEFTEHFADHDMPRSLNTRRLTKAMEKGDVDVLFLNSSYRRYPDCNAVRDAIKNVGLVVFRGHFMNEEAQIANLIIPTPFGFESDGTMFGAERQVFWRDASVKPQGEVVPDWQFYRDIGRRITPDVYPNFDNAGEFYEMFRNAVPSWRGISLERLKKAPSGILWPCYSEDEPSSIGSLFKDNKLMTEDGKLDLDISVLGPLKWQEPQGSPVGQKDSQYPLIFTQGKAVHFWQQSLTNYSKAMAQFSNGREVLVHPDTAAEYGVKDGDAVLIQTERGELHATARVTPNIVKGIIFTASYFSPSAPYEGARGESINTVVPNHWDRISAQFNGFGCRLVKA